MDGPNGFWYINGHDMWLNYSLAVREGTAGFLQYAPKKESITHSWPGVSGIDVDLSKKLFKERTINLRIWGITETESDFWIKRNAFLNELSKPGLTRITITAFQSRSYYVFYNECSAYSQVKSGSLRNIPEHMVIHEFNIIFIEPQPTIESSDTFITADEGEFLII